MQDFGQRLAKIFDEYSRTLGASLAFVLMESRIYHHEIYAGFGVHSGVLGVICRLQADHEVGRKPCRHDAIYQIGVYQSLGAHFPCPQRTCLHEKPGERQSMALRAW